VRGIQTASFWGTKEDVFEQVVDFILSGQYVMLKKQIDFLLKEATSLGASF
jgi:hypothetical protein